MDVHNGSVLSSARPAHVDGTAIATLEPILDTAAAVLAKDPAASLGQVAAAAGIGRTTLHK